jgi:hypothetical protein
MQREKMYPTIGEAKHDFIHINKLNQNNEKQIK